MNLDYRVEHPWHTLFRLNDKMYSAGLYIMLPEAQNPNNRCWRSLNKEISALGIPGDFRHESRPYLGD